MTKVPLLAKPVVSELCYHCGQPNDSQDFTLDNQRFCCNGCMTVYAILKEHQLCGYYTMGGDKAGQKIQESRDVQTYQVLDQKEVLQQMVVYAEGPIQHIVFHIPSIHCSSCIWLLEQLHKFEPSIHWSRINFVKKELIVRYDSTSLKLSDLASLLSKIGYAPLLKMQQLGGQSTTEPNKRLYLRIAVAFFATGNVMLLSFPEYLGLERLEETAFPQFFGFLSLGLAIPVFIFSAQPFFSSAWQGIKAKHLNIDIPLAAGIFVLFARSCYEVITQTGAGYFDSFTGLVFLMLLGRWVQARTWSQLSFERDFKSYFPISARRLSGKLVEHVSVAQLIVGDRIEITPNSIIPADGLLEDAHATLDYSFVTGESNPVFVTQGDTLYAGAKLISEKITSTLTKTVNQSYLTQLWNHDVFKKKTQSRQSALADFAGRWFTSLILVSGLVAFGYWFLFRHDIETAFRAATAVLIVACPCTIALSIPFTMSNMMRLFGKMGVFIKDTQTIERLSAIDTVVFDKTGTISQAQINEAIWYGKFLTQDELECVYALVNQSTHPVSRGIGKWSQDRLTPRPLSVQVKQFSEIAGKGVRGSCGSTLLHIGSAAFIGMHDTGGTWLKIGEEIKGYWNIQPVYRPELGQVMQRLQPMASVSLLSGDHADQATYLKAYFPEEGAMLFQSDPHQKLAFIKQKQQEGRNVLMVGDGLNDSGALAQAQVGIVISEDMNNFTPASDVILDARRFHLIPDIIHIAKQGKMVIYATFALATLYNIVGLWYAMQGALTPLIAAVLMPLSSITVVVAGVLGSTWVMRKLTTINAINDLGH